MHPVARWSACIRGQASVRASFKEAWSKFDLIVVNIYLCFLRIFAASRNGHAVPFSLIDYFGGMSHDESAPPTTTASLLSKI